MIDKDEFNFMLSDLIDELPHVFFRDLHGGIIVSDDCPQSEYSMNNDLFIFGQYRVNNLGRQVVIFKGSFDRFYSHLPQEELKKKLREVLRHEFRHHLEFLGGVHNSKSLEAEDKREIQEYLAGYANWEKASANKEGDSIIDSPFDK